MAPNDLERLLDRMDDAGGLNAVVDAAAVREFPNGVDRILSRRVDSVRCAERVRKLELVARRIDGNDNTAVEEPRRHQRTEADTAETEGGYAAAALWPDLVHQHARPGRQRATKQHRHIQGHTVGQSHQAIFGN